VIGTPELTGASNVLSASIVIDMPVNEWRFMHSVLKGRPNMSSQLRAPAFVARLTLAAITAAPVLAARHDRIGLYGYAHQPLPRDVSFALDASPAGPANFRAAGRASIRRAPSRNRSAVHIEMNRDDRDRPSGA
jgi:hypothetical protein